MNKSKLTIAILIAIILFSALTMLNANKNSNYEALKYTHDRGGGQGIDSGEFFIGYKLCAGCHGYDSTHLANIDEDSNDVNVFDDWRSTMMANSARDPFFHAKVSHEITVNPAHALELQTKCLDCHAPMGAYTALFHGATNYTMAEMFADTLAMEGVSCMSCHIIGTEGLGTRFSGDIPYDTTHKIYGPFTNPFVGPMQLYVGMTPTYSFHMSTSEVCSPCHTLITETADLSGNLTGGTFVEQATYHEYINSIYPLQQIYCQTCHMPQVEEGVIIANQILALQPRSPFNLHQFAGANYFMLNILKNNKTYLGIDVPDAYFDSTLLYTHNNLTQNTIDFSIQEDSVHTDTAYFSITLTNKTGHKFPTGYPARRAVVQFVVLQDNGDTLFKSGVFGSDYEVNNLTAPFEKHHDIVKMQTQTQIYEMIMGDVNGNRTTVLERADIALKDNRLVPKGFTTTHYSYDTSKIDNDALADSDFNKNNIGVQGNGKDIIHYHIPSNGYSGMVNVFASVYYQSVPPGWLQEMFSYSTALIDTFKSMYNAADKTPVLCASGQLLNVFLPSGINGNEIVNEMAVFPSPSNNGYVIVQGNEINSIEIYGSDGKFISRVDGKLRNTVSGIYLPLANGIYFIKISDSIRTKIFKILR